jgi:WD40 repeat protein
MSMSPEGSLIAVGDDQGEMKLFTYDDCRLIHMEQPHSCGISAVAISPDNTLVVTADEKGHILMWRA